MTTRQITTGHLRTLLQEGRLVTLQQVGDLLDITRQGASYKVRRGDLPQPVGKIRNLVLWDKEEVLDWATRRRR